VEDVMPVLNAAAIKNNNQATFCMVMIGKRYSSPDCTLLRAVVDDWFQQFLILCLKDRIVWRYAADPQGAT
jgi:hypothetical protein